MAVAVILAPGRRGVEHVDETNALGLDAAMFPNAAALKVNPAMARLNVTRFNANLDADPSAARR